MHQNQTIKNEILKRNSRIKHRYIKSQYLSKTVPIKLTKTENNNPLIQIRIKYGTLTTVSAQNEIKIKIYNAINQLNDIDSRSVGLSILHSIIDNLPNKLLNLIIEPFYTINSDLKALCRKEIALLIGYICSKYAISYHFYKYLPKLVTNLSKRAKDCDSRVRNACGESFAKITKSCLKFIANYHNNDKIINISNTNELILKIIKPIIKTIEKCISPDSINGNFICLSNVILSADNYLINQHIIIICKCIISNIINIRDSKTHVSLLICIEKLIITSMSKLLIITSSTNIDDNKHDDNYFDALLAIIIDGLSNNDWNVRNHSLKALHSLALILIDNNNSKYISFYKKYCNEIIAHLQRLKYDKISNVRNTAIMVLSIWSQPPKVENEQNDAGDPDRNNDQSHIIELNEITEKPWFDNNDNNHNDSNNGEELEEKRKEYENNHDNNNNALILEQQQLIFKSIKNLESYIRREIGSIKSRIHCVERDLKQFKITQQNNEWINENKEHHKEHKEDSYDNDKEDDNYDDKITITNNETLSIYSDETQIINLNEQLLNIIQLDNNQELIEWLIETNNFKLFEFIDQRLMISLIYRITQLLKTNKYINDICDFLKKEFVLENENISKSFSLPNPLKTEFLKTLKQHDNIKQFVSDIETVII